MAWILLPRYCLSQCARYQRLVDSRGLSRSTEIDVAYRQHQADLRVGAGWVELPHALSRKYPNAGREWRWQWVFPATRQTTDPVSGQRRRHYLHESVTQRAFKRAW